VSGETDLDVLLRSLDPERRRGEYVYVCPPHDLPRGMVYASVDEPEGPSAVVRREDAEALGLEFDYVASWIVLRVHSSLAAVGLTAAVSTALAAEGISCNVIAGLRHDHLLVPASDAERALEMLRRLATGR
jgi:hypothetical protein